MFASRRGRIWPTAGAALSGAVLLAAAGSAAVQELNGTLKLDSQAIQKESLPYYPIRLALSVERPAGVKKEPAYHATPKYGLIKIGNGADNATIVAVDEPSDQDFRIYVDVNRNGDLTDDGDGSWSAKKASNGRTMYGLNHYKVRGSWKLADGKTAQGDYGLAFYRFTGQDYVLMYREAALRGTLMVDGKAVPVLLVENDTDGTYSKPLADPAKAAGSRPVWLIVDLNGNGKFEQSEAKDIRLPFRIGEKAYEATVSADGANLRLAPTTKAVAEAQAPPERPALLAAGTKAPDFTADAWGGGQLKLSQFKGKTVILDFWSTWCGPCQRSMPHLAKVQEAVKGQNVVVLAVCVWDARPAYDKWVPENKSRLNFTYAFDPAGRNNPNIATETFKVSGIPTTYIIDKEGNIAAGVVGFRGDDDDRIEQELKKLGIKLAAAN